MRVYITSPKSNKSVGVVRGLEGIDQKAVAEAQAADPENIDSVLESNTVAKADVVDDE